MPAPLRLRLEQELREAVAERYEHARTPVERTNCQVVLLTDEGRTVTEIAYLSLCTSTLRRAGSGRIFRAPRLRVIVGRSITSLVPAKNADIRDAASQTFAEIENRRVRSSGERCRSSPTSISPTRGSSVPT